eukprot:Tamp_18884.p1 GENE.Tamp_18884~~Tamp_18884.p1  ORF type:complete len:204 (-),score=27.35 Tamp_18884:549-1160(-)
MRSLEDLIARVEKNHTALSEDVAKLTGRRAQKLNPVQQLIKSISDQAQKVRTSIQLRDELERNGRLGSMQVRLPPPLNSTPPTAHSLCLFVRVFVRVCVCVCDCSRANSCTCLWVTLCLAVCVCGCPLELANAVAPPKTNPTRLLCACTAQPPLARVYSHALTPSPALPAALRALQLQQQYAVTSTSSQFSVSGLGYTVWFRG